MWACWLSIQLFSLQFFSVFVYVPVAKIVDVISVEDRPAIFAGSR